MRIIRFTLLTLAFFLLTLPQTSFASNPSQRVIKSNLNKTISSTAQFKGDLTKISEPADFIGQALSVVLTFLSTAFFILIIYAGILWMTAKGDEAQAKKARDTIIAAVIGLILILASYTIVRFIFSEAVGCESRGEGYQCRDYTQCNARISNTSIATARQSCTQENDCYLNICSGGNDVICCK